MVCSTGDTSMTNLSVKARHKLDEISPVMQGLVIDRAAACRIGSSLNAKDRRLWLDFQRCSDLDPSWHSVQFVLGLDQRNIIFALKKGKNRLNFQVVGDDLLPDIQGEEGLIEGEGNTIRQAYATNSDDALALCKRELARHRRIGSHNFFTKYAGRWLAAKSVHILHKTA